MDCALGRLAPSNDQSIFTHSNYSRLILLVDEMKWPDALLSIIRRSRLILTVLLRLRSKDGEMYRRSSVVYVCPIQLNLIIEIDDFRAC